jgi:type I restriction enzyme M protein
MPSTQSNTHHKLDITTLEGWLWEAAYKIRGEIDAPKYKDNILPLIFLKRLSDVFDDEMGKLDEAYGSRKTVEDVLSEDHMLVRFYLPHEYRWEKVAKKAKTLVNSSPIRCDPLFGKIRNSREPLISLISMPLLPVSVSYPMIPSAGQRVEQTTVWAYDMEPDIIERANEYLIRKFAEGSGQSARSSVRCGKVGSRPGMLPRTGRMRHSCWKMRLFSLVRLMSNAGKQMNSVRRSSPGLGLNLNKKDRRTIL